MPGVTPRRRNSRPTGRGRLSQGLGRLSSHGSHLRQGHRGARPEATRRLQHPPGPRARRRPLRSPQRRVRPAASGSGSTPACTRCRGNPPTIRRQMKAAELAVPGAYVSGTGAAVLHESAGLPPRTARGEHPPHGRLHPPRPGPPPTSRCRPPGSTASGPRPSPRPSPTWPRRVGPDVLGPAVDAALLARTTTWAELDLAHRTARARRSPTARPFAEVLLARDPTVAIPQSVLESKLYPLLDDPRLPPHVRQAPAPWDPTGLERVDVTFPTMRWIVEGDGRSWHARVADFERDRAARPRGPAHRLGHLPLHRRRHRPPRLRGRHAARHLRPHHRAA